MGKNLLSKVPCEMATVLGLDNPVSFTFHSLRRSSATAAADSGASVQQLMDFYGWSNPSMPQEYVSSSKASVKSMADKLQGPSNQVEKTEVSEVSIENIKKYSSASPPQSRKPYVIKMQTK